jgi:hypothetical protein
VNHSESHIPSEAEFRSFPVDFLGSSGLLNLSDLGVSLADARERRDQAGKLLANGE